MSMCASKSTSKTRVRATGVLVGLAAATAALAQQATPPKTSPPDFAANQAGSIPIGQDFLPVPGALPPVAADPAHPYVPNGVGRQPTYRIADLSNPNLKPWVKERMRKDNEEVLAGNIAFTPRASCMPAGVPVFMTYSRFEPINFIQTPKEVVMIFAGRPAGPACLSRRAAFRQPEAVLVWRVGRPLRRRYAGRRHHRPEQQDLRG